MRLLLLKDVRKLGHIGDVVEVNTGYARNYLIPQLLAAEPTEENIKAVEQERKRAAAERAQRLKEFETLAEQMTGATATIEAAANPEGTLYGSVGPKEIAATLQAMGYPVRPEHVVLDRPIRTLDNRLVTLEFTDEITTQIKLWVVRAGTTEDEEFRAGPEADEESRFEPDPDDDPR
ncbi:MAG: 50S ribosomal protein L9 [Phycisphaerae bacterium]